MYKKAQKPKQALFVISARQTGLTAEQPSASHPVEKCNG